MNVKQLYETYKEFKIGKQKKNKNKKYMHLTTRFFKVVRLLEIDGVRKLAHVSCFIMYNWLTIKPYSYELLFLFPSMQQLYFKTAVMGMRNFVWPLYNKRKKN